jgi:hypothetical protein
MPAFWPILLTTAQPTLAADRVPNLDIAPTCRAATAAGFCQRDERRARDKLDDSWTDFTAAQRDRCSSLARMGGAPSYVELLTCLEMAKAADKLPDPKLDGQLDDIIRR